jgi:hypothetical protein
MDVNSQNSIILSHLLGGGSLTSLDALHLCGCLRLSARIYDLRAMGHNIESERVCVNGKYVSRYFLK